MSDFIEKLADKLTPGFNFRIDLEEQKTIITEFIVSKYLDFRLKKFSSAKEILGKAEVYVNNVERCFEFELKPPIKIEAEIDSQSYVVIEVERFRLTYNGDNYLRIHPLYTNQYCYADKISYFLTKFESGKGHVRQDNPVYVDSLNSLFQAASHKIEETCTSKLNKMNWCQLLFPLKNYETGEQFFSYEVNKNSPYKNYYENSYRAEDNKLGKDEIGSLLTNELGLSSWSYLSYEADDYTLLEVLLASTKTKVYLFLTKMRNKQNNEMTPLLVNNSDSYILGAERVENTDNIIITDDPSLWNANYNKFEDLAWISTIPGYEYNLSKYDLNAKNVFLFVNNCSGRTIFEDILIKKELSDSLEESGINHNFIFAITDYCGQGHKNHFLKGEENRPQIVKESVTKLNQAEFTELYEIAKEELGKSKIDKDLEILFPQVNNVDVNLEESTKQNLKNEKIIPPFLLRPFIVRKEVSLLIGQKDVGKSAFFCSIVGAILANKDVIDGHPWGPIKPQKVAGTNKHNASLPKVLLFAFEDKVKLESNKNKFAKALLPDKRKADIENFIIEPMSGDLSSESLQKEVLEKIEEAKSKGRTDGKVDFIIIDTMTSALGEHITKGKWGNVKRFITGIAEKNDCAIIVTGHTDTKGNIAGDKSKVISIQNVITLTRQQSDSKTLTDPIDVLLMYRKHTSCSVDIESFQIALDDKSKKFVTFFEEQNGGILSQENCAKRQRKYEGSVVELDNYYKREGYTKEQRLTLLNLGKDKLQKIRKNCKKS